ncbi:tetratricopeptide repeat protein [Owenweeksia hongkongensis]|uniref:tetratricopeptide repeat protein n=1 Tax=Owenweeksia hongkongensis TaxID=253245 RepID=UPI003A8DF43D
MYEDDDLDEENMERILPLINRFEDMLKRKEEWFFDVDEFEALSDYYYENGKVKKALKAVEIAIDQHPSSSSFIVRMAHYHTANNNLKGALKSLKQLENIEPDGYDLFMTRATIYSKAGKHQRALHFYKAALKKANFPEDVWPLIAIEHQMMGNFEMALKYLKLTLEANVDDEIAIYNIALCFDLLDKGEEGISFFKKFTDKNPYCEVAWYHLAILSAKERLNEEALRAIDYAILIDEYFTAAYYEKARILERTFRYKEAAETYMESFEYEGPTGFSYYKIGLCYLNMDKPDKAESYLTKAIQEDQDLDEAFYELALLKDEQKAGAEAIYFIGKALELDTENTDYLFTSAEIHRRGGMLNEAEVIYQNIIEKGFIDPEVFMDYAELLFDLCEFDDGMEVLYQGVQLNPESADMNYRICGYLYTLQESDEADIYFKRAVELNPDRRMFFFELFPKLKESPSINKILQDKRL